MKKLFFTLVIAIMACVSSFAQSAEDLEFYAWENGVGFGLPKGLEILENTADKFLAENEHKDFAFSIVPLEFEKVKGKKLGKFLAELAFGEMGISQKEGDYEIKDVTVTNGEGCYIIGINGDGTPCIAGVFLSSVNNTGCFVFEAFHEEHAEEAGMVIGSINFKE